MYVGADCLVLVPDRFACCRLETARGIWFSPSCCKFQDGTHAVLRSGRCLFMEAQLFCPTPQDFLNLFTI